MYLGLMLCLIRFCKSDQDIHNIPNNNLGVMYVIGGYPESNPIQFRTTSMYNVTTTDISYTGTGDQAPHDVESAGSVLHEGHIYIIGSEGKNLAYNTDTGVYTEIPDNITPRKSNPAVFTINARLYVVGGTDMGWKELSSMESIPLHTLSAGWRTEMAQLPLGTAWFDGCVLAGTAIVAGGLKYGRNNNNKIKHRDAYTWQPGQPSWTRVADMNNVRQNHCMVCAAGHVWVIGGEDAEYNTLSSMKKYNVEQDTWEEMAGMPEGRRRHQCVHDGAGRILVTGGSNVYYTAKSDIFIYNIARNQWHRSQTSLTRTVKGHVAAFVPEI